MGGGLTPTPPLQQQKTDMNALCKKQTTLQAVVYRGFNARGDKLSLSAPQPVRGSMK